MWRRWLPSWRPHQTGKPSALPRARRAERRPSRGQRASMSMRRIRSTTRRRQRRLQMHLRSRPRPADAPTALPRLQRRQGRWPRACNSRAPRAHLFVLGRGLRVQINESHAEAERTRGVCDAAVAESETPTRWSRGRYNSLWPPDRVLALTLTLSNSMRVGVGKHLDIK